MINDNVMEMEASLLPAELQLMAKLMQQTEIDADLLHKVQWEQFLELVWHHRTYPVIYKSLKASSLKHKHIPEHIVERVRREYQRNMFQMLHMTREMENICKQLSQLHIRTLILKGPVLAHELFGDVSHRTSSDLDILIPIEDLNKAEALMVQLGFEKDEYIQSVLSDWKWRHHHVTFIHSEKRLKLEIHWRLGPGPAKEPHFRELWHRKRRSQLTTSPIYMLGLEDLFMFLVSHGARHGWSRLRWLMDIHQLVAQKLQRDVLHKLMRKYQVLHVGQQAIILSTQLLGTAKITSLPEGGQRAKKLAVDAMFYLKHMVNLHSEPLPDEISQYHKKYLFSLMSFKHKLLFMLSFLYPYPEDVDTLPLPERFHFLYFGLRPFLWVWRKTRKQAIS